MLVITFFNFFFSYFLFLLFCICSLLVFSKKLPQEAVNGCVYVYVYIYVCVYVCLCLFLCPCLFLCLSISMFMSIFMSMSMSIFIYIYVCVYVYVCLCLYLVALSFPMWICELMSVCLGCSNPCSFFQPACSPASHERQQRVKRRSKTTNCFVTEQTGHVSIKTRGKRKDSCLS